MLPCFRAADDDRWFVQDVNEYTGEVIGYQEISGVSSSHLRKIQPTPAPRLGAAPTYVFLSADGKTFRGPLSKIGARLKALLKANKLSPALNVQIADLVGTQKQKVAARREMFALLKVQQGESAARAYYEGSALRSALWDGLLARAPDAAAAERFIRVRSMILPSIDKAGVLSVDVSAAPEGDRSWMAADELVNDLREEFSDLALGVKGYEVGLPITAEDPPDLARVIGASGRQEERIAILLRAILADPEWGIAALSRYNDRSQFGTLAVTLMRSRFDNPHYKSDVEILAATAIHDIIKVCHPMSRGRVLYYLAYHLSGYSRVSEIISHFLARSSAAAVDEYRPSISRHLSDGASRGRPTRDEEIEAIATPAPLPLFDTPTMRSRYR